VLALIGRPNGTIKLKTTETRVRNKRYAVVLPDRLQNTSAKDYKVGKRLFIGFVFDAFTDGCFRLG